MNNEKKYEDQSAAYYAFARGEKAKMRGSRGNRRERDKKKTKVRNER